MKIRVFCVVGKKMKEGDKERETESKYDKENDSLYIFKGY